MIAVNELGAEVLTFLYIQGFVFFFFKLVAYKLDMICSECLVLVRCRSCLSDLPVLSNLNSRMDRVLL